MQQETRTMKYFIWNILLRIEEGKRMHVFCFFYILDTFYSLWKNFLKNQYVQQYYRKVDQINTIPFLIHEFFFFKMLTDCFYPFFALLDKITKYKYFMYNLYSTRCDKVIIFQVSSLKSQVVFSCKISDIGLIFYILKATFIIYIL